MNDLKKNVGEKIKKLIEKFKNDDEILVLITEFINEIDNLDNTWIPTIVEILNLPIKRKFIRKLKKFFKDIKDRNNLLVINILLESYETVDDLPEDIKEKSFYVILKELSYILNEKNLTFHQNYTKSLKFLKEFKIKLV